MNDQFQKNESRGSIAPQIQGGRNQACAAVSEYLFPSGLVTGEPAGAPRRLKVVAADRPVEVEHFAGEVQAGHAACSASSANRPRPGRRRRPSPPPCRSRACPSPAARSRLTHCDQPRPVRPCSGPPPCGRPASPASVSSSIAQPARQLPASTTASCFLPDAAVSTRKHSSRSASCPSGQQVDLQAQRRGVGMAADDAAHVEDDRPGQAEVGEQQRAAPLTASTCSPSRTRTPRPAA